MNFNFSKWSRDHFCTNGYLSEFFCLNHGCRQGDPIFHYIFILCVEALGRMLRKNNNIIGIVINEKEYKINQYADDTQLLLDGSEASLREVLNILDTFYRMSGLKINIEKTKAIWIGANFHSQEKLCIDLDLDWNQGSFKILGVNFATEVNNTCIWEVNANDTLNRIINILKQ